MVKKSKKTIKKEDKNVKKDKKINEEKDALIVKIEDSENIYGVIEVDEDA